MNEIDFEQFQKLDIRIGTVKKAEVPKWSHWVMKLSVDFGKEIGSRTIFAGIMKFYKPEDLKEEQFPFVINLKPKKIGPEGDYSEGMLLMSEGDVNLADDNESTSPIFIKPDKKAPNGAKIR